MAKVWRLHDDEPKHKTPEDELGYRVGKYYNYNRVVELLDSGVDVNTVHRSGNSFQSSYLAVAIGWKKNDVAKLLIARGADLNIKNKEGETALCSAIENDNIEGINILVDAGAVIDEKTLEFAVQKSKPKTLNVIQDLYIKKFSTDGFFRHDTTSVYTAQKLPLGDSLRETFDFAARRIVAVLKTPYGVSLQIIEFDSLCDKSAVEAAYDAHLKLGGADVDWRHAPKKKRVW